MSLRTRIAGVAGLAVAIAVVCGASLSYVAIRGELRGEVDKALEANAGRIVDRLSPTPGFTFGFQQSPFGGTFGLQQGGPGDPLEFAPRRPPEFGGPVAYVQLVQPDGQVARLPGEGQLPASSAAMQIARTGNGRRFEDAHVAGTHLRVLTIGLGQLGALQVARPLTETDSVLHRVLWILILVGAGGIAAGAALGGGVARAALAPIRRFTSGTESIATEGDVSRRMEVQGSDELGRLARSFNATLDELERSVEAQRQLVADAGHELRTPIASLRVNIQLLEEADRLPPAERVALRDDIVRELDELTALVADIVELARGTKPSGEADDVRLDLVVQALIERAERRPGVDVTYHVLLEPTLVTGQAERISRAVSNLLDNARKWSPPGGVVEVRLAGGVLTVRDHGPGFDEQDLPHIFDRFFRSDRARALPGSGLGLAIVRQAAEAHGGFVRAENAPSGGALVSVRFSASEHPDPVSQEPLTEAIREGGMIRP